MSNKRLWLILGAMLVVTVSLGLAFGEGGESIDDAASTSTPSTLPSPTESLEPTTSPTATISPEPSPTPEAEQEPEPEPERSLDEEAALRVMQRFTRLYNSGDYINASGYISSRMEDRCGGPTALAFALSQMHRTEQTDYRAIAVKAWDDDPNMADVTIEDNFSGAFLRSKLGLRFVRQVGGWHLDELFPLGTETFCQ